MKHPLGFAGYIALLLCLSGCGNPPSLPPEPISGQFDVDHAFASVKAFTELGAKIAGTLGAERAALYLKEQLDAMGVEARLDIFNEDTPSGTLTFRNVVGRLPGSGNALLLLGSHYDTKSGISSGFAGANDSASSTGVLLEIARTLRRHFQDRPLPFEVRFLFFDGEECQVRYEPGDGFHGSTHYARTLREQETLRPVLGIIVLDMIGDKNLNITIPLNVNNELLARVLTASEQEDVRSVFRLFSNRIFDDHQAFIDKGIPGLVLIDFTYGTAPGLNDIWHTPEDVLDKISPDSLRIVGRTILRTLENWFDEFN